jgi:hypothetical protein
MLLFEKRSDKGDHFVRVVQQGNKMTMEFASSRDAVAGEVQSEIWLDGSTPFHLPVGCWRTFAKGIERLRVQTTQSVDLLVIGLGGGIFPSFLYNYIGPWIRKEAGVHVEIYVVEHDKVVKEAWETHFRPWLTGGDTFHVIISDGVEFVEKCASGSKFDMIFVDAFAGKGNIPAFTTIQFFRDSKAALKADGVLVFNSHLQFASEISKNIKACVECSPDWLHTSDGANVVFVVSPGGGEGEISLRLPEGIRELVVESVAGVKTRAWHKREQRSVAFACLARNTPLL